MGYSPPEVGPDAEVGERRLLDRVGVDRQAADQHKAATVDHVVLDAIEHRAQIRQRESLPVDLEDRGTGRDQRGDGFLELGNLGIVEAVQPFV